MNELREAFDPVANAFEALQIDYRVGGSVASSRFGVARTTLDIDVVADIRSEHIDSFVARLAATYYVDAESIREAIARQRSFNVIHLRTMIKVDVFVLKRRAFDRFAFTRPRAEPIGEDHSRLFKFLSPEDMILLKLEWFRAGGGESRRQWQDVLGILRMQRGRLDLEHLRRWAPSLEVDDLLERALAETAQD
jgi:hypothetical protein